MEDYKMPVKFICEGCGKEVFGVHYPGGWFKPNSWYERSDKDGAQIACSRECIEKVAKETNKTAVVLPV
jgi:hypothetical protein